MCVCALFFLSPRVCISNRRPHDGVPFDCRDDHVEVVESRAAARLGSAQVHEEGVDPRPLRREEPRVLVMVYLIELAWRSREGARAAQAGGASASGGDCEAGHLDGISGSEMARNTARSAPDAAGTQASALMLGALTATLAARPPTGAAWARAAAPALGWRSDARRAA